MPCPLVRPLPSKPTGPDPPQFGELWLPPASRDLNAPNRRYPVVVFIHGGCWLSRYGVAHTRPLSTALAQSGHAVWSLEFRRSGDPGGGWPGSFEDIAAGVEFLSSLAERYPLDLRRIVIAGHSSGGHLALWAANQPLQPKISRAIGLAAIANLESYARGTSACERAAVSLMGGSPSEHPERYALASPIRLSPGATPTLLIHGDADRIVPLEQARAYRSAAQQAGRAVRLQSVRGAGHFDMIHPGGPAWVVLLEALQLEGQDE